jgi:hypothetical protein
VTARVPTLPDHWCGGKSQLLTLLRSLEDSTQAEKHEAHVQRLNRDAAAAAAEQRQPLLAQQPQQPGELVVSTAVGGAAGRAGKENVQPAAAAAKEGGSEPRALGAAGKAAQKPSVPAAAARKVRVEAQEGRGRHTLQHAIARAYLHPSMEQGLAGDADAPGISSSLALLDRRGRPGSTRLHSKGVQAARQALDS